MKITAPEGAKLVGASSPAAGVTEVHEMKMEGDVMKMRAMPFLDLPAGKTVELKPGGYHIMLLDLKAPGQGHHRAREADLQGRQGRGKHPGADPAGGHFGPWHACHARSRCCGPRAWPRRCQALKSPWGLRVMQPRTAAGAARCGHPIASGHGLSKLPCDLLRGIRADMRAALKGSWRDSHFLLFLQGGHERHIPLQFWQIRPRL